MRRAAALLLTLLGACSPAASSAAGTRIQADPVVMAGAFASGFEGDAGDDKKVPMRIVEVGSLKLTSGRVVAVDPFVFHEPKPFTRTVPPGEYPVRLSVAQIDPGHFRVALARVDFSDRPIVRWEMAVTPGQDPKTLKVDEAFTYGVDSGTGAFGDAEAFAFLDDHITEATTHDWIAAGEAHANALELPHGFVLLADAGPSNNIAMFASGWGDGGYASWFGLDAQGKPAALVTDFAVITAVTGLPE